MSREVYDMYWMQPETYRMITGMMRLVKCIAGHENIPNRLRYNAQIEDDLTGLYYLRARYYNTGIGRFTQEDVIYNDGLNLYAYCGSNPIGYGDWDGYKKQPVPFKMGKYDYSDINSIDYNKLLKSYIGDPPKEMYDPHAHHILYKLGRGAEQQKKVQEAQRILVEIYDIDPIKGKEMMCWASNRVLGQHGKEALDAVYNDIIEAKNNYESYDELMVRIDKRKEEAQERCLCKKKVGVE